MIKFTKEEKSKIKKTVNNLFEQKQKEINTMSSMMDIAASIKKSVPKFSKNRELAKDEKRAFAALEENKKRMKLLEKFNDFINENFK